MSGRNIRFRNPHKLVVDGNHRNCGPLLFDPFRYGFLLLVRARPADDETVESRIAECFFTQQTAGFTVAYNGVNGETLLLENHLADTEKLLIVGYLENSNGHFAPQVPRPQSYRYIRGYGIFPPQQLSRFGLHVPSIEAEH